MSKKYYIHEIIHNKRNKLGLNQVQLAKKLSISPQHLWDIEKNRRLPSKDLLIRISKVLKIHKDYLFYLCGNYPDRDCFKFNEKDFMEFIKRFRKGY